MSDKYDVAKLANMSQEMDDWLELMCYMCDGYGTWEHGQTCTYCQGSGQVALNVKTGESIPKDVQKDEQNVDEIEYSAEDYII